MLPLATRYQEALEQVRTDFHGCDKKSKMVSSVTGLAMTGEDCTPAYWSRNMTSTVKFYHAIEKLLEDIPSLTTAIEIGPHPALKGPITESLRALGKTNIEYFQTCSRNKNDFESVLDSVGSLIARGVPVDLQEVNAREVGHGSHRSYEFGNVLTDLPTYRSNHNASFWAESRVSRNVRFRKFPRHQLLGSRYVDDIPQRPCLRNQLILKEIPWLAQLKVRNLLYFVLVFADCPSRMKVRPSSLQPRISS